MLNWVMHKWRSCVDGQQPGKGERQQHGCTRVIIMQLSEPQHHCDKNWRLRHNAKSYWQKHQRCIWHRNASGHWAAMYRMSAAHCTTCHVPSKDHCCDPIMPHTESCNPSCIFSYHLENWLHELSPVRPSKLPNIQVTKSAKCCRLARGPLPQMGIYVMNKTFKNSSIPGYVHMLGIATCQFLFFLFYLFIILYIFYTNFTQCLYSFIHISFILIIIFRCNLFIYH